MSEKVSRGTAAKALEVWKDCLLNPPSLPAVSYKPESSCSADRAVDDPKMVRWVSLMVGTALANNPRMKRVAMRLYFHTGQMTRPTAYRNRNELFDTVARFMERDSKHDTMSIADAAIQEVRRKKRGTCLTVLNLQEVQSEDTGT